MRFGGESSATASRCHPHRSYDVITGHENVYLDKSWQNRVKAVCEVPLCLSCNDATADMLHDLPGSFIRSGHLTWPQVIFFELTYRSTCICLDESQRDEHGLAKRFSLSFLAKKLRWKSWYYLLKPIFFFQMSWKVFDVTRGSQIRLGWTQSITNVSFVFIAKLYCT